MEGIGDSTAPSKSYSIGEVGSDARVQQGENLMWTEITSSIPDSDAMVSQFKKLLEQISNDNSLDDDVKFISAKKTEAVVEGLANAQKKPRDFYHALIDARSWFSNKAGWVWDELSKILQSETAQKTISAIAEGTTRGAIKGLTGSG